MYPNIKGKVAVVTGAGRKKGLGEAMAKRLVAEGAKVVLTDIGAPKGAHFSKEYIGTTEEMEEIVAEIKKGGGGRIISIASQAAKHAFPDLCAYVSSKHALVGLTRTAALEFGQHKITVNTICPNHVTTGLGVRLKNQRLNHQRHPVVIAERLECADILDALVGDFGLLRNPEKIYHDAGRIEPYGLEHGLGDQTRKQRAR